MITSFKRILGQPHTTPSILTPFATATLGIPAPPANTGHFCTCLSPHSHFPWTQKPLLVGSGKDQAKKSPRKANLISALHETPAQPAPRAPAGSSSPSNKLGFKQMFLNQLWVPGTQGKTGWFGCSKWDQGTGSGNQTQQQAGLKK